ncbi:hypothetical protein [Flavobacterium sp. FlaQc-47]|uniref:hypothetical protein n=1 Tax=Flavobacterium sp. FlaQc-47 TaxID=3374180 RepID=UPI0037573A66
MKNIFNYAPYVFVLIIQFLINNYTIILISTILIGFVAAFKIERKKVFLKSFIIGIVVFTTVFFIYESRIEYVKTLIVNLGLPNVLIYVFFPLFNALNTSILFFFGYKIGVFIRDEKLEKTKSNSEFLKEL